MVLSFVFGCCSVVAVVVILEVRFVRHHLFSDFLSNLLCGLFELASLFPDVGHGLPKLLPGQAQGLAEVTSVPLCFSYPSLKPRTVLSQDLEPLLVHLFSDLLHLTSSLIDDFDILPDNLDFISDFV